MKLLFRDYYFYIFYILSLVFFIYAFDLAYPIVVISDEVAQLDLVYKMIEQKSLKLNSYTPYSVWVHYPYILPTLLYWGVYYIFSDLSSIADLKLYILNNYYNVVYFLRIFTALLFFFSLVLVRRMLEALLNKFQANIFFIFMSFNLIVVINTHYAKHWVLDMALIFYAFYFYYIAILKNNNFIKYFSYFLFSFAVLATYPLILSGVYFLFIGAYFYKNKYILYFKDIFSFLLVFLMMIFYSFYAGTGSHVSSGIKSLYFKFGELTKLLYYSFSFDPFVNILFILSIFLLIYKKNYKVLLILIPYLGYSIFISFFHSEVRYSLFLVIESSLIATFFAYYLYKRYKSLSYVLFIIYIIYNGYLIYAWLKIVSKKDTRVQTREWILKWGEEEKRDFIIYNTFSFNYVALNSEGIRFMDKNFPRYSSEREKYHIRYKLEDGVNGILLWKYVQAGYDIEDLIKKLLESNYNIIFINERFYDIYTQSNELEYTKFLEEYEPYLVKEISPYKEGADKEKIGDIFINFSNVFYSLSNLKTSGPLIKIYKLESSINE